MRNSHLLQRLPPVGCDVASLALGAVGGLLFVLPILGIPLALLGLVCGVIALLDGRLRYANKITMALAGCMVTVGVTAANTFVALAPGSRFAPRPARPIVTVIEGHLPASPPAPAASGPRSP